MIIRKVEMKHQAPKKEIFERFRSRNVYVDVVDAPHEDRVNR